jgi:hypothetical protein
MGPTQINGLPAHVLLVHLVVVLIPIAALLLVLSLFVPAAGRRIGVVSPVVAFVALVSVPLTTHAGEWLEKRTRRSPLVEHHAELGDQLLPWAAALFLVAIGVWAVQRRHRTWLPIGGDGRRSGGRRATREARTARLAGVVLAVLALVAATGSVVMVYRIGDSGAKAAWTDAGG